MEKDNEKYNKTLSENSQKMPGTGERYKLVFADNGRGLPEKIDFRNPDTLGLQLVNALVDQIEGSLYLERREGTKFVIEFRNEDLNVNRKYIQQ